MTVNYEWCIEGIDKYGDIQDVNHSDTLSFYVEGHFDLADDEVKKDLGLIRDIWTDYDDLADRVYAYVDGGTLPEYFEESGFKVPKRFHQELMRFNKKGYLK